MAATPPASPEVHSVRVEETTYWWPLTAVVGWIVSRDPAVVAELCEATDAAEKAAVLLLAAHGRWEKAVEPAKDELHVALSADEVTAWGDAGDGSGPQPIRGVDWADLAFDIEPGLDRAVSIGAFGPDGRVGAYQRVRIARDDVLRRWPARDKPTERDPDPLINTREAVQWLIRGAAERAADEESALEELNRRIEAGKLRVEFLWSDERRGVAALFRDGKLVPMDGNACWLDRPDTDPPWRKVRLPKTRFRRADVLRLWPAADPVEPNREACSRPGGATAADADFAGAAPVEAELAVNAARSAPHHAVAAVRKPPSKEKLLDFLIKAADGKKTKPQIRAEAEDYFGISIPDKKIWRLAWNELPQEKKRRQGERRHVRQIDLG